MFFLLEFLSESETDRGLSLAPFCGGRSLKSIWFPVSSRWYSPLITKDFALLRRGRDPRLFPENDAGLVRPCGSNLITSCVSKLTGFGSIAARFSSDLEVWITFGTFKNMDLFDLLFLSPLSTLAINPLLSGAIMGSVWTLGIMLDLDHDSFLTSDSIFSLNCFRLVFGCFGWLRFRQICSRASFLSLLILWDLLISCVLLWPSSSCDSSSEIDVFFGTSSS